MFEKIDTMTDNIINEQMDLEKNDQKFVTRICKLEIALFIRFGQVKNS